MSFWRILTSEASIYNESTKDDSEVEAVIRQKTEITNEGFWKVFRFIRKDRYPKNLKKVYRINEAILFNNREPQRKRLPARIKNSLVTQSKKT